MNYCIVTGADHKYFKVLTGLLDSIAPLAARIVVVNLGLFPDQAANLAARDAVEVVAFTYPYDFPAKAAATRDFPGFGAMLVRPHLNNVVSDADIIVWMDADTWAQDPGAVLELVKEAAAHGIAAVPEVDRSYFKYTFAGRAGWETERADNERYFGPEIAERMRHVPVVNSGFWAAQRSSALWPAWQHYLQDALRRFAALDAATRMVEQAAFNVAIEREQLVVRRFPATYNWLVCLALPAWSVATRCFVDPSPPHDPIKIIHISGQYVGFGAKLPLIGHDGGNVMRVPSMTYPVLEMLRGLP